MVTNSSTIQVSLSDTECQHAAGHTPNYEVICANDHNIRYGEGRPAFTMFVKDAQQFECFLRDEPYSVALRFVQGQFDVQGDIVAAIRMKAAATVHGFRYGLATAAARFAPHRLESWLQTHARAARDVRFHYDRSNDFYRLFLDSRMVYSCAYFADTGQSLETAQLAKLDHICRKLDLRPEEQFLDVGCGWGALVLRAAGRFGASATGCTLSQQQASFASQATAESNLEGRVCIREADYRQLHGRFDKIASVGMFEHVGRRRLGEYFRRISTLLQDDGLFLNHGIVRPQPVRVGPETLFLERQVFPGGELAHLSGVIREAENAGFEVLDLENLRPHYALTCRRWVERLQQNAVECRRLVGDRTYRTWLLYLAASALSFESQSTDVYQILLAKRTSHQRRHLTRSYMYT